MKGCDAGAVVDCKGIFVMGGESKEGHEIPGGSVGQRSVKKAIDIIHISREGRELEYFETSQRSSRGGGKTAGGSTVSSGPIVEFKEERRSG